MGLKLISRCRCKEVFHLPFPFPRLLQIARIDIDHQPNTYRQSQKPKHANTKFIPKLIKIITKYTFHKTNTIGPID